MNARRDRLLGRVGFALLTARLATGVPSLSGAEIDLSKLPAPAAVQVDFARDIKPILDASCIRCHGPEKPKSGYRLDHRVGALKPGKGGTNILTGHSAESPLIHFVARLVPDMEMPPEGKGPPLTPEQVALFRAWIDQGTVWADVAPTNALDVSIAPAFGWTTVRGDSRKFREHYWRQDGFDGGLEHFELFQQTGPDTRTLITGRAFRDDYKVTLSVDRNEVGFVRSGWTQYRKYYDDTGGVPSPSIQPQSLGRDLHLDIGKAWIDVGLTLPHWPRMVLGYEYDYRQGEEAITSWGSDRSSSDPRNVGPATKRLDEGTHVLKFDLDAEVRGVTIEDRFRGEFYNLNSHYTNVAARASVSQNARTESDSFQGANSIRLEKKFTRWLLGSGGYFYSKLNADEAFSDRTINNGVVYQAAVPNIELSRESHVFNLTSLLGPFEGLTVSAGAQAEWTRQHGFGSGNLNGIAYTRQPGSLAISPATVEADYDQNTVSETVGLRYTRIRYTSLFADARFKQESIDHSESDLQPGASFMENPSYENHSTDVRAGAHVSPWQRASLSAHYRWYESDSHYKTNDAPQPPGGYPGFISHRDQTGNEVEAKLVLRLSSLLKTTLSYQWATVDYDQDTRPAFDGTPPTFYSPGGHLLAGKSDSHIYSLGMTFTPRRRWSLSGMFSYQDSKVTTESSGRIPPYKGSIYSALANGTYLLNQATDIAINYAFSFADYTQASSPQYPPPLGIRYQQHAVQAILSRRFGKNLTTRLQYAYYLYDEPTTANVNNYMAHSIFGVLNYRIP